MHDVVVDEATLRDDASKVLDFASDLENRYQRYMEIMLEVETNYVKDGATADKLHAFTDCARELMGHFYGLADDLDTFTESFIREVDAADDAIGM